MASYFQLTSAGTNKSFSCTSLSCLADNDKLVLAMDYLATPVSRFALVKPEMWPIEQQSNEFDDSADCRPRT
jgi:hypothetical protein